jgi:ATP-dependent Clp protease ATP-binding subunit ClpA
MFERYTEKARQVIFFGRDEASSFGSSYIEGHHLLLGMLRANWKLFEPFLKSRAAAGVIRKEIEQRFPRQGPSAANAVDLPLSHASKRVVAWAAEEAQRLRHKHIGTEHLLLGLLREPGSGVPEILGQHGMTLETVRAAVARPFETDIEGDPNVGASVSWFRVQDLTDRAALHSAVLALPADRQDAAWRIVEALGRKKVTVEVTGPEGGFTVSLDTMAPT